MSSITAVDAACACGAFKVALSFPTSSLPHPRALCVCSSCRRLTGTCGTTYIPLPKTTSYDPTSSSLTAYNSSERAIRYFCTTCGAHTVLYNTSSGGISVATGLLDRTEGIVKWMGSKWILGTFDGGVSIWLNSITDADGLKRELGRWMLQDDGERVPAQALRTYQPLKPRELGEGRLKAQCHCGGVKFYITRPNEASKTVKSPFSDLIVPYHGGSNENPENKSWWLRANDTRYMAGICTCKSCRVSSGMEFQTWAFIPRPNLFQENGQPMDYNTGTLKRYNSSPGVYREFCSRCGATVYWHSDERPDLIDVSVGLFDPAEGARMEGWLEWWTERVSFEELAVSRSLVRALQHGLLHSEAKNNLG